VPGRATVSTERSMDCLAFRARIERGEPLDAAAREHARVCEACGAVALDDAAVARRLLAAAAARVGASDEDGGPSVASLAATQRLLARDQGLLGALRARPTWQRIAVLVALLGAGGARMVYVGAPHAPFEVAVHVLVFTASCALMLWPLGRPLPVFGRTAGVVLALAVPFFAALVAVDRRAALGLGQALLAGSIAGVAGNALLHLHCPSDALAHLLLGHATVGVVAATAAVGMERLRAPRTAP